MYESVSVAFLRKNEQVREREEEEYVFMRNRYYFHFFQAYRSKAT